MSVNLDDVVYNHPLARAELEQLRATVENMRVENGEMRVSIAQFEKHFRERCYFKYADRCAALLAMKGEKQ